LFSLCVNNLHLLIHVSLCPLNLAQTGIIDITAYFIIKKV